MSKKAKVTIISDSRKKADVVIEKGGFLTFNSDTVVRIDDDDDHPCKATKLLLLKIRGSRNNDVTN